MPRPLFSEPTQAEIDEFLRRLDSYRRAQSEPVYVRYTGRYTLPIEMVPINADRTHWRPRHAAK